MGGMPCFWVELADTCEVILRRYARGQIRGRGVHFCDNSFAIERRPWSPPEEIAKLFRSDAIMRYDESDFPHDDPRWPRRCECGYEFAPEDGWQCNVSRLVVRPDTGEILSSRPLPVGAMMDARWGVRKGPDGMALLVMTPGGEWLVDSRATNCTMPEETRHYRWVREGDPRKPETVTVGKNGVTCKAGAGSIQCGNYHGFLRQGYLLQA